MTRLVPYIAFFFISVSAYGAALFRGWEPFAASSEKGHLPAGVVGHRSAYPSFWVAGFGGK